MLIQLKYVIGLCFVSAVIMCFNVIHQCFMPGNVEVYAADLIVARLHGHANNQQQSHTHPHTILWQVSIPTMIQLPKSPLPYHHQHECPVQTVCPPFGADGPLYDVRAPSPAPGGRRVGHFLL